MKRSFLLPAIVAITSFLGARAVAQNIYTYAGVAGTFGYSGDDSLATLAKLNGPDGIAVSTAGVVYFADYGNNVVRAVNASGIITTLAGTGMGGYSGDGGAATAAKLRQPGGIAVDGSGNIYIADTRNNVVRMVNTSGIITTVAGVGGPGGYSGDGGPATSAQLWTPAGVAVDDAGNLYISDARNLVVRKVNASGVISTIAGNNTPGYSGDGGAATAAQLFAPLGIAVTASGNLYIADSRNNVIRVVNTATGVIHTFAGTGTAGHSGDGGPASAALLYSPSDVKADIAGNIFISDSSNTVRVVNTGDTIKDFAGTGTPGYGGDGGPATAAKMTGPTGLAIDASHNVYICTPGNNVIRRVGAPIAGISITSNVGDTACIGHVTNFTATAVADATPHYQWQQNGVSVGTDANTYTPTSIATGDIIDCILLSAASPSGAELAMSNNIQIDSLPVTGTINGPANFCTGSSDNLRDIGGPFMGGNWVSSNTAVATINPMGMVTALSTGATNIYFILSDACGADTASFAVTVHANTIGAISGPSVVCEGASVTYTDGTTPGLWRTRPSPFPGPNPFGTIDSATGVFTAGFIPGPDIIFYGTSRSCYKADTIMIDSLPVNAPISGPTVVDSSWTITLTDPNPGGVWTSSDTTIATVDPSAGIVTGVAPGTVTITYTITNAAGCSADTTYQVLVASGTGVNSIVVNSAFHVFPNPSPGYLNIVWANQISGKGIVTITDVSGRTVYTSAITINNTTGATRLDISSLKTGIYMLSVTSEQGFYCSKLVVE